MSASHPVTPGTDDQPALAERIRAALVEQALAAFEDAGVRGLCCEGAWEAAVWAMRQADLTPLLSSVPRAKG